MKVLIASKVGHGFNADTVLFYPEFKLAFRACDSHLGCHPVPERQFALVGLCPALTANHAGFAVPEHAESNSGLALLAEVGLPVAIWTAQISLRTHFVNS